MAFQPGQSGNPGGRPKQDPVVRQMAQEQGPAAVALMVECLSHEDKRIALKAAELLLDRGFGKPMQATVIQGDDEGGPVRVEKVERVIVRPADTNG